MKTELAPLPTAGAVDRVSYPSRIVVRDSGRILVVKVDEIEWISACGNYVEINAGRRTCLHRGGVSEFMTRLSPESFVRLQRSLIIRKDKVSLVETVGKGRYLLHMRSGARLPTQRPVNEIRKLLLM